MDARIEPTIVRDKLAATESFWRLARIDGLTTIGLTKAIKAYSILEVLLRTPDNRSSMTDVAKYLGLSRSNLTRMVDALEREGLVQRDLKGQSVDRRVTMIQLTDAGHEISERVQPIEARVAKAVTDCLSDDELGVLIEYLERLETSARSLLPATVSRKRS
jgi:DNA-binding MarR family transcriptional regulator